MLLHMLSSSAFKLFSERSALGFKIKKCIYTETEQNLNLTFVKQIFIIRRMIILIAFLPKGKSSA